MDYEDEYAGMDDEDEYAGMDDEERAYMVRRFRDPGGSSALHPGERTRKCPTCGKENALTAADVAAGYQCDECAARAEGTYCGADY